MDPFNPPRRSRQQINQWWQIPKVLVVVFAISLIILGLFPHYLQDQRITVVLLLLGIAMQLAIAVPIVQIIIDWNKRNDQKTSTH